MQSHEKLIKIWQGACSAKFCKMNGLYFIVLILTYVILAHLPTHLALRGQTEFLVMFCVVKQEFSLENCNGNNTAACSSFSKLYSLAIEWNIYLYNTPCQLFILKHSFSFFVLFLSLFVHTYVYYTRTLIIFPPTLTHSSFLV